VRAGECKKTLSGTNYNEYNGEILCTTCQRRHSTHGAVTLNNSSAPAAAAAAAAGDDDDEDAGDSTPTPQSHADEVKHYTTRFLSVSVDPSLKTQQRRRTW